MRKLFFVIIFTTIFTTHTYAKSGIEVYGDIFQFMPLFAAAITIGMNDYIGLKDLALTFGSTMAITFAGKYTFEALSKNYPNSTIADLSMRPNSSNYQGLPSGHTSSAFSGAGYLQFRYGYQIGLPSLLLATLVGASRIYADKHSLFQVVAGAAIGYGMAYLFTNKLNENVKILPIIGKNKKADIYGIEVSYRW